MKKKKIKATEKEVVIAERLWRSTYDLSPQLSDFKEQCNEEILAAVDVRPAQVTPAVMKIILKKRLEQLNTSYDMDIAARGTTQHPCLMPREVIQFKNEAEKKVAQKVFDRETLTEEETAIARRIFPDGIPIIRKPVKVKKDKEGKVILPTKVVKRDQFGNKVGTQANLMNVAILGCLENKVFTIKCVAKETKLNRGRVAGHLSHLQEKGLVATTKGGWKLTGAKLEALPGKESRKPRAKKDKEAEDAEDLAAKLARKLIKSQNVQKTMKRKKLVKRGM